MSPTWKRREVLGAIGAAVATGLVGRRAEGAAGVVGAPTLPILTDLAPGTALGPCRLARVMPIERGGVPVVLVDPRGREVVVEVHRHDDRAAAPSPLARAGSLAVYLRNGGDGATRTDESHGLGAMALAQRLVARERAGARVPKLASILERWQRFDGPAR